MTEVLGNLVSDQLSTEGELYDVVSPVTGDTICTVPVLEQEGVEQALAGLEEGAGFNRTDVLAFLDRLKSQLISSKDRLLELNHLETGFIESDNHEIIDALIEYLDDFEQSANNGVPQAPSMVKHSYSSDHGRSMKLIKRPYQCVAVLVPQNASLALAVISIASALFVGAKVIIRPSLQCGATGSKLAELLNASQPPKSSVSLVNSKASHFLKACYQSNLVGLVHYIGSDQYAQAVLSESFTHGKMAIIDGEGNGMLYVDESFPLAKAVQIIVGGVTRYNGETCTSINGVLVHPSAYEALKAALLEAFEGLSVGYPRDEGVNLGPLFSARQAQVTMDKIKDSKEANILCGGEVEQAYFSPTIITGVAKDDLIVKEGFFAPAVWLAPADQNDLWSWLDVNRFPLSDTILSHKPSLIKEFVTRSKAARICINEDPSIESMFEPWGGYPPGGLNPVSVWTEKYLHTIQVDGGLDDLELF